MMTSRVAWICTALGLLVPSAAAQCTPSTLPEYTCEVESLGVTVHYALGADRSTLKLAAVAPTTGYTAVGVGNGMTRSQFVLGYVNGGDVLKTYADLGGKSLDGLESGEVTLAAATWATNLAVVEENGKTTTSFVYDITTGNAVSSRTKVSDTTAARIVFSWSSADNIQLHNVKNTITVNLDESMPAVPVTSAPETPAPPTPAPSCTASTLSGYKCQEEVSQGMQPVGVVHYSLSADKTQVMLAFEASVTGYAALGVGTGMLNAQMVLGYVDGQATVRTFVNPSATSGTAMLAAETTAASAAWVSDSSVVEANGKTTTSFTYNIAQGGMITDTSAASLVVAASTSDGIPYHNGGRTPFTLNLDLGLLDATARTPAPATASTPAPATPTPPVAGCTVSNLPGYKCQEEVPQMGAVHYSLSADKTQVMLAFEASVTGYAALGVGTSMLNAQMVLGYVANGEQSVHSFVNPSTRTGSAMLAAETTPASATWVSDYSVAEANGKTTTSFTYDIAQGGMITDTSAASFLFASSGSDAVTVHSLKTIMSVNLDLALVSTTEAPAVTCTASDLSGFRCSKSVSVTGGTIAVHWSLHTLDASVAFAVVVPGTGYASLGFGAGMAPAEAVVGSASSSGSSTLAYKLTARSADGLSAGGVSWYDASSASVTEAAGSTTLQFTRTTNGLNLAETSLIVAYHSTSDTVQYHTGRAVLKVVLDARTTPAPETETASPVQTTGSPPAAPACTSSTLEVQGGTGTYECVADVGAGLKLHWTLAATRLFALEGTAAGYLAMGFPESPGSMGPGAALIATAAGAQKYRIGGGKSLGDVNVDTTVLPLVGGLGSATVSGSTVLFWTEAAAASGRRASVQQSGDVLQFNYALHSSSNNLEIHTTRGSVSINLASASVTPAPETETASPVQTTGSPPAAPACTRSTLEVQGGTGTYECVADVGAGLKLHWTLAATRLFALEGTAAGYLAMGFPESPGSMGPGAALIATAAGVQKYRIGGGKSLGDVNVDTTVLPLVNGFGSATVSGSTVLFWTEVAAASGRQASVQQSGTVLQFNYALHSSSNNLEIHTTRGSADINLASASVTDTSASSKQDEVKTHAGILVTVWCFLVPFGILAKRFLPLVTTAKVGTFPVPFVLHAALMFIAIVLTIAMVGLALDQFESGTEKSHKEIGIVVLVGCILQLVMQAAKCDGESEHRWIFRAVHMVLGFVTLALSMAQVFTGADNYERIYANDSDFAEDIRITALAGMVVFFVAYLALSVLQVIRKRTSDTQEEQQTSPDQELESAT